MTQAPLSPPGPAESRGDSPAAATIGSVRRTLFIWLLAGALLAGCSSAPSTSPTTTLPNRASLEACNLAKQWTQNPSLSDTEHSAIEASTASSHASLRVDGRALAAGEGNPAATMTAWGKLLGTCYRLKLIKPPSPTRATERIN
jgi:hypothetical protein